MITDPDRTLITGASSGIGAALARHYAAPGKRLWLCARNAERLRIVAAECRARGAEVHEQALDVCDAPALRAWIKAAGPLDLVFANAGISGGAGNTASMESPEQVQRIFDVNWQGVVNTVQAALPGMLARGHGKIALVSSLAGYHGWPGAPAYCASKAAVRIYGQALGGALRKHGIGVHVICPGFVVSAMTDANAFPMPFIMPAEKAARIIDRGIQAGKPSILFPWQARIMLGLIMNLPERWSQTLLTALPAKKPLS